MKPPTAASWVLVLLHLTLAPMLAGLASGESAALGGEPCCCTAPEEASCCGPRGEGPELEPAGCDCCLAPAPGSGGEPPELPPRPAPRADPQRGKTAVEPLPLAPRGLRGGRVERTGSAPPGAGPPERLLNCSLRL